ncbi:unnamed protein product [Cladocopium goreaui]|uniref:Insulysin n=1 Tax=Cladocopium goreaui TaxID=2562237 RepID=A0A9P1GDJ3_9DINO|nr:unnamed protein product [Cladocopium goreaui]
MSNIHQRRTDSQRGRSFSTFELANGLRVVVGTDPDKSVAAAALAVLGGSIHEPKERPGLAHFCEHMLLHGTLQPGYDANFAEYIKQAGGTHNAVTTVLQTCFAFEIQSEKLEGALSRFARFFVSPIFNPSYQYQELQAIDAEHSMNTTNDFRRQWAILLLDANPEHPYHWTSGCTKSLQNPLLRTNLHQALETFHAHAYKADRMSLALVGNQSTKELTEWVCKYFACVPSSRVRSKDLNDLMGAGIGKGEPPFLHEDFCSQVFVVPVKELHQFKLSWLLPWQVAKWKSKPTAYVKYLLEQEGDGSLLAALAAAGLSQNHAVNCFDYHGVASTLELSVDLVNTTEETLMRVGTLAFAYISLIRSKEVQQELWAEIRELHELQFHYPDELGGSAASAPFDFVQDIACNSHYYPPEQVLAADQLIYTEDFEGCQSILRHMTVQNARLCLVSKDFESFCVSTEPWYGGKFLKCDTIKMDWKNKWMAVETGQWEHIAKQENFRLPGKNSFIPKDLVMRHVPKESRPVEMNVGDSWCRAWFKQANLDQPKAAAAFCFYSSALRTPKEVALAHLYCKLLQQELKADAFQLRMAGARYQLDVAEGGNGIVLQVIGFRDKMHLLAKKVSESLISLNLLQSWRQVKDQQERTLRNATRGQAYHQALKTLEELLLQSPSVTELAQATSLLREEDCTGLFSKFRGHCESLALQLEEPAHNAWEALSQDWLYIQERTFAFDTRDQQVKFLRNCSLQRFRAFVTTEVQSSPRLAILLRSPKVAWHRVQWSGAEREARFLTKWELSSYKAELVPSPSNSMFGKVSTAPEVSRSGSHRKTNGLDCTEYVQLEDPTVRSAQNQSDDLIIEEGEECKVVLTAILHEVTELKDVADTIQRKIFEDHYSTLGISAHATQAEIATGFKRALTKLNSKHQADQRNRARLNAAHSVLSDSDAKSAYDKHRKFVNTTTLFLASASVSLLVMIVLRLLARMVFGAEELDPRSFLGKVTTSLDKVELRVQIQLTKEEGESFGAQLQSDRSGKMLHVCGVCSDGALSRHNHEVQSQPVYNVGSTQPPGMLWWNAPVLWEGDIIESVNDIKGQASDLMSSLKSSESSSLLVRRSLSANVSIWPWICERRVSRQTSERWGFKLRTCDGSDSLEVFGIEEGGIAQWNEANPETAIRVGDRVVAVDKSVGSKDMLAALTEPRESVCVLVIRGVLMPSSVAPSSEEVLCGPICKNEGQKLGIRIGRCIDSPPGCGMLAEPGTLSSIVVKEVVKDHLVDRWNSLRGLNEQLIPGSVVTAVNGRRRKEEFARELSKQQVCISFRRLSASLHAPQDTTPATSETPGRSVNSDVRPLDIKLDQEELQPWAVRAFGSWVPRFLLPRPFEEQLRTRLRALRCQFDVKICKTDARPLGIKVQQAGEELQVLEVVKDGAIALYNSNLISPSEPRVEQNDWLVGADDKKVPRLIVQHLSTVTAEVVLHLERPASKAAPGVWEIEVAKSANEGWGLELFSTPGHSSPSVLNVRAVGPGAIQRWNENQETLWRVQPGDLLLACEPEVEPLRILKRLQDVHRVRLTLLRWHKGPAPLPEVQTDAKRSFEVTFCRMVDSDHVGIRMQAPARDPTRSVVTEVVPGGLADKHNKAAPESQRIMKGDEVISVNGEANVHRFREIGIKESTIVIKLSRPAHSLAKEGARREPGGNAPIVTESAVAAGPQNPNRVDRDIKDDPIQNGDDRGLEDDTVKAPEPKTMHEVHEACEVHDVSRGSANGRAEGETYEPTGQPAAEPGRRFSDRCDNCDGRDLPDPPAEQADGADVARPVKDSSKAKGAVEKPGPAWEVPLPATVVQLRRSSPAPENSESMEEMLKMLALPPESAIASLAVGLDPLSRERFNQSISKMEDLVASLPTVLSG